MLQGDENMENYILLLHESTTPSKALSPDEMQAIIAKYKAWGQRLAEAGRLTGSNKLERGSGRMVRGKAGDVRISDGPFTETKDVIGGYFMVKAENYDAAVDLCRDCPHLEFGGAIEVRRVEVV
jgi:hypothetical protein